MVQITIEISESPQLRILWCSMVLHPKSRGDVLNKYGITRMRRTTYIRTMSLLANRSNKNMNTFLPYRKSNSSNSNCNAWKVYRKLRDRKMKETSSPAAEHKSIANATKRPYNMGGKKKSNYFS